MTISEIYIKRCLQLAKNGLGHTYPNPMVGSVIVYNDKIIGEGWHQKAGEVHAEVNAINSVFDKTLLKESTIYVNLEPCSHFGKTPPCADLIIKHNIPKVVIGTIDPFAEVEGRGIKKLEEAGIEVIVGVCEQKCRDLNKRFFTFHRHKRPYIILKWAQTTNGFIAPLQKEQQKPFWITNAYSRQLVHKWRSEEQAILVGTNTVLQDNPSLTTRDWYGKNPIRLVIDRLNQLSNNLTVFNSEAETVVFSEENSDFENLPQAIGKYCYKNNLQSLIVEGGAKTLQSFIDFGFWDEARVFEGGSSFKKGIESPQLNGYLESSTAIKDDRLKIYTNPL